MGRGIIKPWRVKRHERIEVIFLRSSEGKRSDHRASLGFRAGTLRRPTDSRRDQGPVVDGVFVLCSEAPEQDVRAKRQEGRELVTGNDRREGNPL